MTLSDQPRPVDRVVVLPEGPDVVVRCAGCAHEARLPADPVATFLDEVQDFVHAHSACDVRAVVRVPKPRASAG